MSATVWSLESLGWKLGIRAEQLEDLARRAPRLYKPYLKKRPGKKPRKIDNPADELKAIQRKIYRLLLRPLEVPEHLHGGVNGRSPFTNALQHLGKPYIVRIDIRDFFPSITDRQVYNIWRTLGYGPKPASVLTALTTFRARLPQGVPTSTALANLVLLAPDSEIQRRAVLEGCIFTRFVDDLAFSGSRPQALIEKAIGILGSAGFRISRKKLAIMRNSERQELTGYGLNSPRGPSVPRYRRSRVRAAIHQLGGFSTLPEVTEEQHHSVRGRISKLRRPTLAAPWRFDSNSLKRLSPRLRREFST